MTIIYLVVSVGRKGRKGGRWDKTVNTNDYSFPVYRPDRTTIAQFFKYESGHVGTLGNCKEVTAQGSLTASMVVSVHGGNRTAEF